MALTVGTGPFGHRPAGVFNREMPDLKGLIWFTDHPRRMRATFAGETVVDSRHAKLLYEHGHLPVLYFPLDEVRDDLLEPTDHSTHCPWKGDASYWSVRVGDRMAENAMWGYPDPIDGAPPIAGYRALYWHSMDGWLEEDEEAIVHVRDPWHRVDVLDTSRHVRVSVEGETLARAPVCASSTRQGFRRAGTSRSTTSAASTSSTARRPLDARTRAMRPTGRSGWAATRSRISRGPTANLARTPRGSATTSRSSTSEWTSRWTASSRSGR